MLCLTCKSLCFLCLGEHHIHACSKASLQIFLQHYSFCDY